MDKQIMVYSVNGILLSNKEGQMWMYLKIFCPVKEAIHTSKYCMISFVCNSKKDKANLWWKKIITVIDSAGRWALTGKGTREFSGMM